MGMKFHKCGQILDVLYVPSGLKSITDFFFCCSSLKKGEGFKNQGEIISAKNFEDLRQTGFLTPPHQSSPTPLL